MLCWVAVLLGCWAAGLLGWALFDAKVSERNSNSDKMPPIMYC
jgi:hypothetical protein